MGGVLLFTVHRLAMNQYRLGPASAALIDAGKALIELVAVWDASPACLAQDAIDRCEALWEQFMDCTHDMELLQRPKRHAVSHIISRLADQGNPKAAANWYDEALNKLLKAACRQASQTTFEEGVVRRMRPLLANRKRIRDW